MEELSLKWLNNVMFQKKIGLNTEHSYNANSFYGSYKSQSSIQMKILKEIQS